MAKPQDLITLAEAEIGYIEKASTKDLDNPIGNPGSKNYTKYARDVDAAKILNGAKQGYEWCAVFVMWLMVTAWGAAEAVRRGCIGLYSAGCEWVAKYYQKAGRWFTTPEAGDQVVFQTRDKDTGEWVACHTGLVVGVTATKIMTIEGNTSGASGLIPNGGMVAKKSYARSSSYIMGYGRPLYDADDGPVSSGSGCPYTEPTEVVRMGSMGSGVGWVQWHLDKLGYDLGKWGIDEDAGEYTDKAIRAFQAAHGLEVDGIVGPITKAALVTAVAGQETPAQERTYTVKPGDSLSRIAREQLGAASRWPEIQALNGMTGTVIHPGQVLKLPSE